MAGQQRPCDPEWLLAKFQELDVFPPGFVLQCPVCNRQMPPASMKGSAQLLQCQHRDGETGEPTIQMAQDGKCYTINTRGVAFGGPNLKDLQGHIVAWGRTPQGMECLAKWKGTMSDESEASYWATLAENKRLVEAGAAQQAARQVAEQQAGAGAARVGPIKLSSSSAAKTSRVGKEYQAILPELQDRNAPVTLADSVHDKNRQGIPLGVGDAEKFDVFFEEGAYAECPQCHQHLQAPQRANALECPICHHQLTAAAAKAAAGKWTDEELQAFDRGMMNMGKALLTAPRQGSFAARQFSGSIPPELSRRTGADLVVHYYKDWKFSEADNEWQGSSAKHNKLSCALCLTESSGVAGINGGADNGGSGLLCCDGCPAAYHLRCLAHDDAERDQSAPEGYVPIPLTAGVLSLGLLPRHSGWYCRRCVEAKQHLPVGSAGELRSMTRARKKARIATPHQDRKDRRDSWITAGRPRMNICHPSCTHCKRSKSISGEARNTPATGGSPAEGVRQTTGKRRHAIAANKAIAAYRFEQSDAKSNRDIARLIKQTSASPVSTPRTIGRCLGKREAADLLGEA